LAKIFPGIGGSDKIRNPKFETRNKVKIQMRNNQKTDIKAILDFQDFLNCFGFRISRFGFPGEFLTGPGLD